MENLYKQYPNAKDFANFLLEQAREFATSNDVLNLIEEKLVKYYDDMVDMNISDEQVEATIRSTISSSAVGAKIKKKFGWNDLSDSDIAREIFLISPAVSIDDRKKFKINIGCSIALPINVNYISKEALSIIKTELTNSGYRPYDKRRYVNRNLTTHQFLLENKIDISNDFKKIIPGFVKFLKTNGFEESRDYIIKSSNNKILIEFNPNTEVNGDTSTWDSKGGKKMKKFNVGDSIKFKDGRTGIVEDYDEKYFYIRDNNENIVKILKDNQNDAISILRKLQRQIDGSVFGNDYSSDEELIKIFNSEVINKLRSFVSKYSYNGNAYMKALSPEQYEIIIKTSSGTIDIDAHLTFDEIDGMGTTGAKIVVEGNAAGFGFTILNKTLEYVED